MGAGEGCGVAVVLWRGISRKASWGSCVVNKLSALEGLLDECAQL